MLAKHSPRLFRAYMPLRNIFYLNEKYTNIPTNYQLEFTAFVLVGSAAAIAGKQTKGGLCAFEFDSTAVLQLTKESCKNCLCGTNRFWVNFADLKSDRKVKE